MKRSWNAAFFALVLIACGVLLLMEEFTAYEFHWKTWWPLLLCVIGVYDHIKYFASGRTNPEHLTSGGVMLVYGGLFLFCNLNGWSWMEHLWPIFLLGPAFGLLEAKIAHYHSRSWVPIFILMIIGGSFLSKEFTDWSWMATMGIGLMIIGVGMLLGNIFKKKNPT